MPFLSLRNESSCQQGNMPRGSVTQGESRSIDSRHYKEGYFLRSRRIVEADVPMVICMIQSCNVTFLFPAPYSIPYHLRWADICLRRSNESK
jgi:hypothetical protein